MHVYVEIGKSAYRKLYRTIELSFGIIALFERYSLLQMIMQRHSPHNMGK